jgi:hypothetical protein
LTINNDAFVRVKDGQQVQVKAISWCAVQNHPKHHPLTHRLGKSSSDTVLIVERSSIHVHTAALRGQEHLTSLSAPHSQVVKGHVVAMIDHN